MASTQPAPPAAPAAAAAAGTPAKLSNAELKKQQKAEKAARRAAAKESEPAPTAAAAPSAAPPTQLLQRYPSTGSQSEKGRQSPAISVSAPLSGLQVPGRKLSTRRQSVTSRNVLTLSPGVEAASVAAPSKNVAFFGHLYEHSRRRTIKGAPKNIHPHVVSLGVQMSNYVVCGSSSRCLAMLQAFKEVPLLYCQYCHIFLSYPLRLNYKLTVPGHPHIHNPRRNVASTASGVSSSVPSHRIPQVVPATECQYGKCHPNSQGPYCKD